MYEVVTRAAGGKVTAIGSAGPFTVVIDRPAEHGGGGLGFNGGQLLHLAVAGCVSNDLFREADARGIRLESVEVRADGDFAGTPGVSTGITYDVSVSGSGTEQELRDLVEIVDQIAEIPNSLRGTTSVTLASVTVQVIDAPRHSGSGGGVRP
jgi:organic hydroperoxide reductase OsmC/OhrA